jgi:type II secretory pathway pseudopilin PulG
MGQPIPAQHPSVVLRSHFKLVRGLLAIAMVAVLGLTAAVVILANDDEQINSATKATPVVQQQAQTPAGVRYDGGPNEGSAALATQASVPATTRFDGGPEEGTRGPQSYYESPSARSSYQPAPADSFKERAGGPTTIPQGPASRRR